MRDLARGEVGRDGGAAQRFLPHAWGQNEAGHSGVRLFWIVGHRVVARSELAASVAGVLVLAARLKD